MLDASAYKVLHFLGMFMVVMALGAILVNNSRGNAASERWKKVAGITHGAGLLILLVAGFGLLAKQGLGFDLWVSLKLLIWLILAAMGVLARKFADSAAILWWVVLLLAFAAACLGHYQPF